MNGILLDLSIWNGIPLDCRALNGIRLDWRVWNVIPLDWRISSVLARASDRINVTGARFGRTRRLSGKFHDS